MPEADVPEPLVLYIAGQGRSGSTLVERVLGELPGVCALGEAGHVWQDRLHAQERCGCGAWFASCEFWSAVGEHAFGGWHRVGTQRILRLWYEVGRTRVIPRLVRPSPARLRVISELVDYYRRLYSAAAHVSGARIIVDSSKYPALAFCLRWATLDLRVIHLVRDPRGVAYSWTKHLARPETDGATLVPQYPPARSALRWGVQNAAVEVLARLRRQRAQKLSHRVPIRRVHYEDFLADPRSTTQSLAAFAEIELTSAELSYLGDGYADLGPIHSASGNPMRFHTGRTWLRPDNTWQTKLPPGQRRLVTAICAPLLVPYGYPLLPTGRHPTNRTATVD